MKNVYSIKCTQLTPTHEEETIGYEDTLEKFESVTSEEYIKAHKNFTDGICSAALADRLPYNYCIERCGKEQKGMVYLTDSFATKLAALAYGCLSGCSNTMPVQDALHISASMTVIS